MAKINVNLDSLKPKREWKRHKVQPGHNIFRILPPFGEAANGYPYRKWMITWGLADPESGRLRPFASSLTTQKHCPIYEYVDALTKKAEDIKTQMKASGASDNDVKERLKELNKLIGNLRPKTVYAYNAISKAGEVGLLEVKATAHKKLKVLMMDYIKDYNQDPTSLNSDPDDSGVWFDFIRVGEGFDTEYDVAKVQLKSKDANGRNTFVDDQSALPAGVIANYADSAYDLGSIYQVKSYDELRQILLANIASIANDVPDAVVAGFDDFAPANQPVAAQYSAPSTVKPTGTKQVNLKFDADEADEASAPVATQPAAKAPTSAKPATIDDDVFAMADSILGG